nr:hypothetical protein [Tanacetum cinerariifolium]
MMVEAPEEVGEGSEVLDLKKAKTAQAKEIVDLKKRVNKLENKKKSKSSGLKRLWKIGSTPRVESSKDKESLGAQEDASKQRMIIDNIDQDEEIALVDETQGRINKEEMFRVNDLDGDKVIVDAIAGEEVEKSIKVAEMEVSTVGPVTTLSLKEIKVAKLKPKSLKKKSFDEIQKLFDSVMRRVNTFVDMNTKIVEKRSKKTQAEVTEGNSKRAGDKIEQESAKRQRLEKEDDSAKLKRCLEIVPDNG